MSPSVNPAPPPDDFVLGEMLGKGGTGLVFRAGQSGLDRDVAFKTILPAHAQDPETRRKFHAEARVTGQLDHPNIVPVHELAASADGSLFYTMKVVRGRPWSKALPILSESENIDILLKVAVAFAHGKGVIHRDLKPEIRTSPIRPCSPWRTAGSSAPTWQTPKSPTRHPWPNSPWKRSTSTTTP